MLKGTKVYRAYVSIWDDRITTWMDEAVVTDVVVDGTVFLQWHDSLVPMADVWHVAKTDAKHDQLRGMIRFIGQWQAKADKLADEILHETLSTDPNVAAEQEAAA